jgi:hypothetical protein
MAFMILDLISMVIFLALLLVTLLLLRKIARILLPVLILAMPIYVRYRLGIFSSFLP